MDSHLDVDVRWLERGEGDAVMLLHGLMGQAQHWDEVLDALSSGYRAIAPTLPIFDPHLRECSIGQLAGFAVRLLDELGIERATIGGNSLGGHVAIDIAFSYPARVSGLILTGSSGLFERSFTRGVSHRPSAQYIREKMEEIFWNRQLVTPEWVESVRRAVTDTPTALRVLRFARSARRDNVELRLGTIAVPTLLVWGADDRITPLSVAERFHSLIPDAKLAVLPRCGHAPMLERPDDFAMIVERWLEETRLRRGGAPKPLGGRR